MAETIRPTASPAAATPIGTISTKRRAKRTPALVALWYGSLNGPGPAISDTRRVRTDDPAPSGTAPPAFDDSWSGAGQGIAGYGERERPVGGAMAREIEVGAAAELVPGVVRGAGRYAVGNADGELFAVTRRCRHLGADLANGSVDREGCLVCPWHGARYDVATGRMTRGPQGFFAKIPGSDAGYRLMTRLLPLGRGVLVEREGAVFVR